MKATGPAATARPTRAATHARAVSREILLVYVSSRVTAINNASELAPRPSHHVAKPNVREPRPVRGVAESPICPLPRPIGHATPMRHQPTHTRVPAKHRPTPLAAGAVRSALRRGHPLREAAGVQPASRPLVRPGEEAAAVEQRAPAVPGNNYTIRGCRKRREPVPPCRVVSGSLSSSSFLPFQRMSPFRAVHEFAAVHPVKHHGSANVSWPRRGKTRIILWQPSHRHHQTRRTCFRNTEFAPGSGTTR